MTRDVIIGGGSPDHAETITLLLPVEVVMIGQEVVVRRSNTRRVMLPLLLLLDLVIVL